MIRRLAVLGLTVSGWLLAVSGWVLLLVQAMSDKSCDACHRRGFAAGERAGRRRGFAEAMDAQLVPGVAL